MLEAFDPVEIFISDLHVLPGGVANPAGTFRPAAAFLGDPAAYAARYADRAPIAGIPELRPMGRRRLARLNLFWAAYRHLSPFNPGPWELLLPLIWEDRKLEVRLVVPELGLDLPVAVRTVVWPTGWSTSLEIRLADAVTRETALALSAVLRATQDRKPFVLAGQPGPASQVFRHVGKRIASALLLDADTGGPTIAAWYVLAVADASRTAAQYGSLTIPQRQAVHQLLLGKAGAAQQAALKNEGKLTRIAESDFAVTHPDHGTVLCLTELADDPDFVERGFHCFAANVRTAWAQMLMLAHFVGQVTNGGKQNDPRVGPLAASARQILTQAQAGAKHFFTRELCLIHPTIAKLATPGANPPPAAAAPP
jgi:hypothetical protein